MKHYIYSKLGYGVAGDLNAALADPADAPTTSEGARLTAQDFEEVSTEEYEDATLDLRYENGEWQQ